MTQARGSNSVQIGVKQPKLLFRMIPILTEFETLYVTLTFKNFSQLFSYKDDISVGIFNINGNLNIENEIGR